MNTQIQELDDVELNGLIGGNPFLVPIITGIAVGITLSVTNSIVNNWGSFKAGLFGDPDPALVKAK